RPHRDGGAVSRAEPIEQGVTTTMPWTDEERRQQADDVCGSFERFFRTRTPQDLVEPFSFQIERADVEPFVEALNAEIERRRRGSLWAKALAEGVRIQVVLEATVTASLGSDMPP
ncbi:MAG: hypothetical protein O7C98_15245, partial [Planctomycetota bacterium]|nr:hypothetical protein [Planctomycetota bacterium]